MKKILLMSVSLVLVAVIAISGTLAYLTDTDGKVNVMTMGNVSIEQLEYERVTDENGDPVPGVLDEDFTANYGITQSYKLQEFTQAKPAVPAVYTNDAHTTAWDEFQQLWNQVGAPGSNDIFDNSMKNVIDKFVFVENTGNTDAYYRTIIAIEVPEGVSGDTVHTNMNGNSRFDYNDDKEGAQNSTDSNKFVAIIDDVRYVVYVATYTEVLKPGEVSRPSLLQVFLDPNTTSEECAMFGDTWEILTFTQAVQADGFSDADVALDAAFEDINEGNHPWIDKVDGLVRADYTKEEAAASENYLYTTSSGRPNVAGYKLNPAGETVDNVIVLDDTASDVLLRGISGAGITGDIVISDSYTEGTYALHATATEASDTSLTVNNSTIRGWTSYSGFDTVVFDGCVFAAGGEYNFIRAYDDTTFAGCEFEGTELDLDAAFAAAGGTVTLENCTFNGVKITSANLSELLADAAWTANVVIK